MTLDSARLCAAPDCRTHHDVPGSPPRVAVDGLLLCRVHRLRLAENATLCEARYDECGRALSITSGTAGTRVSGNPGSPNAAINVGAIEARTAIVQTLTRLALHPNTGIAYQRGFTPPAPTVRAMARFVASNAEWLAARPDAGTTSVELQLVVDRARTAAYPTPLRRFPIRTETGAFIDCPQRIAWPDGEVYGPAEADGKVRCPGVLWFVQRAARTDWMCNGCGHVVPPVEWVRHARLIRMVAA